MEENAHVCRFVLLSTARTGSNLLLSLLSRHSAIKTYGELFNLDTLPRADLLEALEAPVMYLRKKVYKTHRPETAAVGFKMFYDHLTQDYFDKMVDVSDASKAVQDTFRKFAAFIEANYDGPTLQRRFRDAWEFLIADKSLAVIHLRRRNSLDSLISLKTAYMTRQWWSLKGSDALRPTVHLNPDECRRYFDKLETAAEQADVAFGGHRKLDLSYEGLVADRDDVLRRIFAFLGVPYEPVSTRMKKQNLVPPSQSVANYGELKQCFEHSKWSVFFE
jgi:LPS sulfotransferase NodH